VARNLEWHLNTDIELVRIRIAQGDAVQIPRQIDHAAYFRSRSDAVAASRDLEAAGFVVVETRRRWFHVDVEFTRTAPVDLETVQATTRQLVDLVEKHGGTYDGWGAFDVTRRT
jgi:hypothetical protein